MPEGNKENITLAIETAVTGGSLALFMDGRELDLWLGGEGVSRSEDLLLSISDILARNSLDRSDISQIAVSTGPGSYTGIRVGISTALGLKNALGISCLGFQVLDAMNGALAPHSRPAVAAIPLGRNEICRQSFGSEGAGELFVEKIEQFVDFLDTNDTICALLHTKLYSQLVSNPDLNCELIDAGSGLAGYIGLAAQKREARSGIMPVYVRDFV